MKNQASKTLMDLYNFSISLINWSSHNSYVLPPALLSSIKKKKKKRDDKQSTHTKDFNCLHKNVYSFTFINVFTGDNPHCGMIFVLIIELKTIKLFFEILHVHNHPT